MSKQYGVTVECITYNPRTCKWVLYEGNGVYTSHNSQQSAEAALYTIQAHSTEALEQLTGVKQ